MMRSRFSQRTNGFVVQVAQFALLVGLCFQLGSSSAQASRARLLVLGTGDAGTALNGGSFFYDDSYNIFYNPAYVNDFRNWAIIEKSNFPGASAQGGVFGSIGQFNFGVYLNRGNAVATYPSFAISGAGAAPLGNAASTYTVVPQRPIEAYFGADMGVKWGVGLTFASNNSATGNSNYLLAHLGASVSGFEPFGTIRLGGTEPGATHSMYRAGLRYRWGEWTPYGAYTNTRDEAGGVTQRENTWGLGLGRSTKVTEGINMNYALSFWRVSDAGGAVEGTRYLLPLDVSFEGAVLTWLTLRAGVGYRVLDRAKVGTDANSQTVGDSTTGRVGASFHVGKVDFDWAVGKAGGTTEAATTPDTQVFDVSTGFFTAASLSYKW